MKYKSAITYSKSTLVLTTNASIQLNKDTPKKEVRTKQFCAQVLLTMGTINANKAAIAELFEPFNGEKPRRIATA